MDLRGSNKFDIYCHSFNTQMNKKLNNSTLEIRSELNLSSIQFPKSPKNISVPEELNEYLRIQIDQTKHENESLRREILLKNEEIEQYQKEINSISEKLKVYEGSDNTDYASATQLANSKIFELSKKLREKNAEIEVYKSKCQKQENNLEQLKIKTEEILEAEKEKDGLSTDPDELKKLQDKLTHITNKWTEEKNLNLQLKNDLKRANKWLVQEVGDNFETLLTLNNGNSGWRGRAQIVCDLQQKNRDLKEKLKMYQDNSKDKSSQNAQISLTEKYESKMEALNVENAELKNAYSETKRKFGTMKARCKALEHEYGVLKVKVAKLTEIHETDQETINKLTLQISKYNDLKTQDIKSKDHIIKNILQENEQLKMELEKEKCLSENKSKELLEKNDNIQVLNKRIRSARPTSSYIRKPENSETKTINKLEVELIKITELMEIQNKRLEDERNSHLHTKQMLQIEKQKCAKLEANVARLQLEYNSSRSGYSSKITTPKSKDIYIEDKLELAEEKIKALTTRLENESLERKHDLQQFTKILKNCRCT